MIIILYGSNLAQYCDSQYITKISNSGLGLPYWISCCQHVKENLKIKMIA